MFFLDHFLNILNSCNDTTLITLKDTQRFINESINDILVKKDFNIYSFNDKEILINEINNLILNIKKEKNKK